MEKAIVKAVFQVVSSLPLGNLVKNYEDCTPDHMRYL